MSVIVCSLSGSPLTEAVISLKTGHVYEKSTITRHIQTYGTCPHTKQPLTISDLLPLSTNFKQTPMTNAQFTDVDKIIPKFQSQYQALVLQAHYLKGMVKDSRQELAHSLYRQDASIRVIAKLQEEVNQHKEQLAKLIRQRKLRNID